MDIQHKNQQILYITFLYVTSYNHSGSENTETVQNIIKSQSILVKTADRNLLLNNVIINLQLLLASVYKLKHLKKSMHHTFFWELVISINYSAGKSTKLNKLAY